MKHASRIQALEGLLSRVQRRAAEPRTTPRFDAEHAPAAAERHDPVPPAARTAHDPSPAPPAVVHVEKAPEAKTPELASPPLPVAEEAPLAAKAEHTPEAKVESAPEPKAPDAPVAKAEPAPEPKAPEPPPVAKAEHAQPEKGAQKHDEPPVTRADPQSEMLARSSEELEELGPADEQPLSSTRRTAPPAATTADELEVLEEDDVIDGSPAPPKAGVPVVVARPAPPAPVDSGPTSGEVISAELIPEPPPPRPQLRSVPPPLPGVAKSERPRSIPPPFPGVAKPPKPESLEADVPQRRDLGPTPEQLGGTIELEEGPPADLELAPVAGPKAEEAPSEDEAVLPKATSPGLFTGPRPSAPQEAPPEPVAAAVALEVPASPAPLAAPAPLPAPAPVAIAIAPEITARATPSAEVAKFVVAARAPAAEKLGDLLDATLALGT